MDSKNTLSHLDPLKIVLIVAGIFAIGSIGFFLAIFLGQGPGATQNTALTPVSGSGQQLTTEQKEEALAQLNVSATSTDSGVAAASATSTSGSGTSTAPASSSDQSGSSNLTTAEKLKRLQDLNSQ